MQFDFIKRNNQSSDPASLALSDLVAVRPPYIRGPLAPGRRGPGGERPGRGQAPGLDFDGISPYQPGDDIRRIDWRATARTGSVQMKRFAAQSHRGRMIVVDLQSELCFGTETRPMLKTAALMAGRFAWESSLLHEPVGLAVPGKGIVVPPQRGTRHVLRLLQAITTAYHDAAEHLAGELAGLVLEAANSGAPGDEIAVISDFGREVSSLLHATRGLGEAKFLHAIIIDDAIHSKPVAPGRYPSLSTIEGRNAFAVSRTAANTDEDSVQSTARRRSLLNAGWQVSYARDLLPKQER